MRIAGPSRLFVLGALLWAAGPARAEDRSQEIYVYVGEQGRPVFVNGRSRVPAAFRARARRVDLSKVSLNTALGRELERAVTEERTRLERAARADAEGGAGSWLARLWQDHDYLVVTAGFMLLLLVLSPWIARRVGLGRWGRLLLHVLPLLVALGLMGYAAHRTGQVFRQLRGARQERAAALEELQRALHGAPQRRR